MDDEEMSNEGFKVTDRRRFTEDGEDKGQHGDREPKNEEKQDQKASRTDRGESAQASTLPPMDFSALVLSLAETALFHLGLLRIPGSEEVKKDLQAARQTIDLIAMLQDKTRGNLTDSEQKVITETLYQLRMTFVEASK